MISLIVLLIVMAVNLIFIQRIVRPIVERYGKKDGIRTTKVTLYFDNDAIIKLLRKLAQETTGDQKEKFQKVYRNYIGMQILLLAALIGTIITMVLQNQSD